MPRSYCHDKHRSYRRPTLSAIQLLDDTNVSSQAGSTLRIVIASRDRLGNDRRGKEFLEDADLFQIRIRRTDSLQIKEPNISLVPMHDKNGMDTGQYHGILVLESVGTYTVDVTVAEYTTTRLGRWGVVRPVTKDSISIIVKPGKCHPAASTLTRLTEHGNIEVMYNMDLDTCDAYASVARKDILKAGISGQTESLQKSFGLDRLRRHVPLWTFRIMAYTLGLDNIYKIKLSTT